VFLFFLGARRIAGSQGPRPLRRAGASNTVNLRYCLPPPSVLTIKGLTRMAMPRTRTTVRRAIVNRAPHSRSPSGAAWLAHRVQSGLTRRCYLLFFPGAWRVSGSQGADPLRRAVGISLKHGFALQPPSTLTIKRGLAGPRVRRP